MPDIRSIPSASVAVLMLTLGQTAFMNTALATGSQVAGAPAAAPTAAASPAQGAVAAQPPAAPDNAGEHQAAALAERQQRYAELRASAAEIGVALPETPPWETAGRFGRPDLSERMRGMSPEERQAMRDARWQQMRAEAAERGIEMSETPPWVEAEKRREERQERFAQYRKTIEQMSDEQREAARALFGHQSQMPYPPAPPAVEGYPSWNPPCHHEPYGMTYPPMRPYMMPGDEQGAPPPAD